MFSVYIHNTGGVFINIILYTPLFRELCRLSCVEIFGDRRVGWRLLERESVESRESSVCILYTYTRVCDTQ